jgi:hypothetical protein
MRAMVVVAMLAIFSLPISAQLPKEGGGGCSCYFDDECDLLCGGYGQCTPNGKADGTCGPWKPHGGIFDAVAWSKAADLYFEAYQVPVKAGEGRPDERLLQVAGKIELGDDTRGNHEVLQQVIFECLDAALGFDFQFPQPGQSTGNIRGVPPEATELVEAVRKGFVNALVKKDPNVAAVPIREFWKNHPNYVPRHTGRYYPHGHAGPPPNPEKSQIYAVTTRVAVLLGNPTPQKKLSQ